eukprot:jgi/Mesvir1/26489/Mv25605-RA.1
MGDFIRAVPSRVVRYGGPGPRTEKLCVLFEGPSLQAPPGTHLPDPLVFHAGPWCAVDRGAYWKQVEITFFPQIPLPLPQPAVPHLPLVVGHTVRFGSEDWWDWRYHVDGVGHVVAPPKKVAPTEGRAFLDRTVPDFAGAQKTTINDDHVRTEVFMMGVNFFSVHRCGVVDRSALTLIFTHPQYFAGFLAMWPPGTWVELSRVGRQKVSPYQVAFECDLRSHPGAMIQQMTPMGHQALPRPSSSGVPPAADAKVVVKVL